MVGDEKAIARGRTGSNSVNGNESEQAGMSPEKCR